MYRLAAVLIRCAGNIVPFENSFPRNTRLYQLMTTKPDEALRGGVNLYMKQHRSREPPLAPCIFLGGMPLKEIKTKPENGKPRLLDSAAKAPKPQ